MTQWSTLEDYIVHLIKTKQTETLEFQSLLRIFGREKFKEIYKKMIASQTPCVTETGSSQNKRASTT